MSAPQKIEKPYNIKDRRDNEDFYREFIETYGPGYAAPDRDTLNNNLKLYCPSKALADKYLPYFPTSSQFFQQSWEYAQTYLIPAIVENHRSLEKLRFNKIKDYPTHNTLKRIYSTMKSILQLLDAWIDSNGGEHFNFAKRAKWRLDCLQEKLKSLDVLLLDDLKKREKKLYLTIHWDSYETLLYDLTHYFQEDLGKYWEFGVQEYLNFRDFPLSKEAHIKQTRKIDPNMLETVCAPYVQIPITPIDKISDNIIMSCDGCFRAIPFAALTLINEKHYCSECMTPTKCTGCGQTFEKGDLTPAPDKSEYFYCDPCYDFLYGAEIQCAKCGKTIQKSNSFISVIDKNDPNKRYCKDCFIPNLEAASNLQCPYQRRNEEGKYYCGSPNSLVVKEVYYNPCDKPPFEKCHSFPKIEVHTIKEDKKEAP